MTTIYIAGVGLASSLGSELSEALSNLAQPPQPQHRRLKGLDHSIPYYAIPLPLTSWRERCQILLRQVVAEAGVSNRQGHLYIASSSANVGAMEMGESYAANQPGLLAELGKMLDWQGAIFWINTACTSSLSAILTARDALAAGLTENALVIGLELENQLCLGGFAGMQLLSAQQAKPFARDRDGLVLGEAVAAIHLTRQASRWKMLGGAQIVDSSQVSGASISAYREMLCQTLVQTGWQPEQIDLIKVQAAGSIGNDAVEAAALTDFFPQLPPLLSLKTLLGHTLGASGAAEIALLLALLENRQWPNLTLAEDKLDPELGLNFAAELPAATRNILICNLGFGGSHGCLALQYSEAGHAGL